MAAPVVVADITATNSVNNETFTLDGMGINFLAGSIFFSEQFTMG